MRSDTAIHEVAAVVAELSKPITPAEAGDGWTVESKAAIHKYFSGLQAALSQGGDLPPLGVVRGLDHWGVSEGPLFLSIVRVISMVRGK